MSLSKLTTTSLLDLLQYRLHYTVAILLNQSTLFEYFNAKKKKYGYGN